MQVSHVRFFRRAAVSLILIVLAAVGFNYVQSWRRRAHIVQRAAQILGTDVMRSADRIEYSENQNGVVRFRLRAERLVETRQGTSVLQGIDAYDSNPDGTPRNRILSRNADYDREREVVRFFDDVKIFARQGVELNTNSLVYERAAGRGSSDDEVRVTARQGSGTARGFRYDNNAGTLELLHEVDFNFRRPVRLADGTTREDRVRIRAQSASYSKEGQWLLFAGGAQLESQESNLAGNEIQARFTPDRSRITSLSCHGNAVYRSVLGTETRTLEGDRLDFAIGEESGALERIDILRTGVFTLQSPEGRHELRGDEIHVAVDPASGRPALVSGRGSMAFRQGREDGETAVAGESLEASFAAGTGALQELRVREHARMTTRTSAEPNQEELRADQLQVGFLQSNGRSLPTYMRAEGGATWRSAPRPAAPGRSAAPGRTLTSTSLEILYAESGDSPESGTASGNVLIEQTPAAPSKNAQEIRRLRADRVRFRFFARDNRISRFDADGQVIIIFDRPPERPGSGSPSEYQTASSSMTAVFREADGAIDTVVQSGNVTFRDGSRTATSDRSEYVAGKDLLLLRGSPRIADESGVTTGEVIEFNSNEKRVTVRRRVRSALRSRTDVSANPFTSSSPTSATLVTADTMEYWTEEARAMYTGNVQLLSESSQLQVERLETLRGGETIAGTGRVRHLILRAEAFAAPSADRQTDSPSRSKDPRMDENTNVLVSAGKLLYSKDENSIHYRDSVTMTSGNLVLSSDVLDAELDGEGRNIDHGRASGRVRIRQGERSVTGDSAEYFLTSGKFVVLGNPAEIVDPARGRSAARRLTFYRSDDRILLENR